MYKLSQHISQYSTFHRNLNVLGCDSKYINWLLDSPKLQKYVQTWMISGVERAMQEKLGKELPQTFSPTNNLYVHYKVTNMTWTDEAVIINANAAVSTTVNGKNETFEPARAIQDKDENTELLSLDWPFQNQRDNHSHLLQGVNISTEFLSRFVEHQFNK